MASLRETILSHAGVFTSKKVNVPSWGVDVFVRGMTIKEFEINQDRSEPGKVTAALVARCVLDENGARIFRDEDVSQIAELGFAEVNVLGEAISEQSGMTDESAKVIEGNSEAAPSGNSVSESPETSDAPLTS